MENERIEKKKELYKLAVGRSDVTAALNSCKLLLGQVGHLTEDVYEALRNDFYEPMLHAIVIAYARPFSGNRPHGRLKPEWSKFTDPKLQKIHDQVISMRDGAVAHSDFAQRKVRVFPAGAPIGKTGHKLGGLSLSVSKSVGGVAFVQDVLELCQFSGSRISLEVERLKEELYGSKPLPPEGYELTFESDF